MIGLLLVTILAAPLIPAQESDNKTRCTAELEEWCNGMRYPEEGGGIAIVSLSYHDESGFQRVFCFTDSDGSNCTRNGSPWIACAPDHTLTYKGQVLTADVADDGICDTADRVFNTLSLQNFSYDNATLTKLQEDMGSFFEEMAAMQRQMQELQRRLAGDFWNGFSDFFSGGSDEVVPVVGNNSKDSNQIERE